MPSRRCAGGCGCNGFLQSPVIVRPFPNSADRSNSCYSPAWPRRHNPEIMGTSRAKSYLKEIENFNANLPMLIEGNTSFQLVSQSEEVRKKHGDNPIEAGRAVGADAVLTGLL